MHKVYLLLRDNKQSGPYTLDELVQLSPKSMDLIWVEGRSAGWQYPAEIEALKPFVADTLPAKKIENPASEQTPSPSHSITTQKTDTQPQAVPDSAKHIYISFPANTSFAAAQAQNIPEETPEDSLEKKAEAIRKKVQAFAEGKKEQAEEGKPEVKYSRSLEDMKEEYATWMYQQKEKKKGSTQHKKVILLAALLVAILTSGYFIGKNIIRTEPVVQQSEPSPATITTQQKFATNQPEKVVGNPPANEITNLASTSTHTSLQPLSAASNLEITKKEPLQMQQKVMQKEKSRTSETIVKSSGNLPLISPENNDNRNSNTNPAETTATKSTLPTTDPVPEHVPVKPTAKSDDATIPLPKLVEISEAPEDNNQGSKVYLTVKNNSNLHINMVAVDVYYYKDDARLLEKKTVYFNNIPPKSFMSLVPPKERRAASVKYQIGLISSEKGLFYLR